MFDMNPFSNTINIYKREVTLSDSPLEKENFEMLGFIMERMVHNRHLCTQQSHVIVIFIIWYAKPSSYWYLCAGH